MKRKILNSVSVVALMMVMGAAFIFPQPASAQECLTSFWTEGMISYSLIACEDGSWTYTTRIGDCMTISNSDGGFFAFCASE